MDINSLPSERAGIAGVLVPASYAAGTYNTTWIPMKNWHTLMAILQVGLMGASGTIDAKLRQATDATGSGAKDITGKALTQVVKASGDNTVHEINLRPEQLDVNNLFAFVSLQVTVGTAASLIAAVLQGQDARYGVATEFDTASVGQVIS